MDEGITFSTYDTLYFTAVDLHKVLCVIADKWVRQIPKVSADHPAYAVANRSVVLIEHLYDAVILRDMITVMGSSFVCVGGTFTAVGVYHITTKGFLYLISVDIGKGRACSKHMHGTVMVHIGMIVTILCQEVKRDGVGSYKQG